MTTRLNPYLAFRGQARDAITFYASVLGGEPSIMAFSDMGGMGVADDEAHLVMHSDLMVIAGVSIMCSDWTTSMPGEATNGSVSLSGDDDAQLRTWWDGLSAGGDVTMPLEKAPWGDSFGQFTDKFGVAWMFNIAGSAQE